MKKSLKIIFTSLFIGIFLFLSNKIIYKINYKKQIEQNTKSIPKLSYLNINGENFTNENLKKVTPVIFIYFSTDCNYCNEEAQIINKNIKILKDIQIIFVSCENINLIKKFAQYNHLNNYDNIHFLYDGKASFAPTFDVNSIPCIVLYDKNHNLIEKINGQTKPEILIKKLNSQQ
ncbi:TlpA family protein disulfide reductase [Flavobacterium sp. KACC 22761]|uniref:TlpA family protein disulfide reductase n=1 Tax=Flavobacterium sp. KACC 22761 TaxID=3092665 RepID=UPI002A75C0A0|nr:redoxin family protein [Flavobacterium sp. KACC 22761]WPO79721.1 redoxin family protein [Flavobacterium sp. KACC 22761]